MWNYLTMWFLGGFLLITVLGVASGGETAACLEGCTCMPAVRMDCRNQQISVSRWQHGQRHKAFSFGQTVDFQGAKGLDLRFLPCRPFWNTQKISFLSTGIPCSETRKWEHRCRLKVSTKTNLKHLQKDIFTVSYGKFYYN